MKLLIYHYPKPLGTPPSYRSTSYAQARFAQDGAATRSRTLDLLITSELLYQLSYGGQNGCEILKNEHGQRNRHTEFYCGSSLAAGRNDTSPLDTTRVTPFCSNRSPPVISTPRTIPSCDSPPKTKIAAWSCKQCAESKASRKGKIELYGELAALLKLGTEPKNEHPQAESEGVQITMVAGAGFEPATFRL